nr:class I SAM-dependent methyltransferase [Frankia sp. ArI3]
MTTRWESLTAGRSGRRYADRFVQLAAAGVDVHGEAAFCHALAPAESRILDAGCGTGRVAIRLAELGHRCVGVDADPSMLGVARDRSAAVSWILADLADLDAPVASGAPEPAGAPPATDGPFDLIVAAGNVIALLAPGTEAAILRGLARRLAPGGLLVAGFGLDAAHLPPARRSLRAGGLRRLVRRRRPHPRPPVRHLAAHTLRDRRDRRRPPRPRRGAGRCPRLRRERPPQISPDQPFCSIN